MRSVLPLFALLASLAFAPAPVHRPKPDDLKAMQGEWQLHKWIDNGREATAADVRKVGVDAAIKVAGDQWTQSIWLPTADGSLEERGTLTVRKVDQMKSPKQIVLGCDYGDLVCIYRLDGDTLAIRCGDVGVAPADFTSSTTLPLTGASEIMVFKRKNP
jgi:uncharacterized protein (TIGR03067 family)